MLLLMSLELQFQDRTWTLPSCDSDTLSLQVWTDLVLMISLKRKLKN